MAPKAAEKKPASTAGKAPAKTAGKAPSAAKKAVKKTTADGDKKKKRKTRKETYSTYIYKVLKQVSRALECYCLLMIELTRV